MIVLLPLLLLSAVPAHAALAQGDYAEVVPPADILLLALFALTIGAVMLAAVWLIRQRTVLAADNDALRAALADSRAEAEARAAMLVADRQRLIVYSGAGAPEILGHLPREAGTPADPGRFSAFAEWLPLEDAATIEAAIDRLRRRAEGFCLQFDTPSGMPVQVTGQTLGGLAVVRFTALEGLKGELAALTASHGRVMATIETMQGLFDALSMPVWLRDRNRRLVWANEAYAAGVEAASVADAVERQMEFFGEQARAAIAAGIAEAGTFTDKLSAVVAGDRRNFSVIDVAGTLGSAGIAVDISDAEAVRMELRQTIASHSETLDQLTTAVARFDEKTQLQYCNAAFQKLFDFTSAYLDSRPDHVAMLDQLRTRGVLPEDRPLRDLKEDILAAYRATKSSDSLWHLADGRTLRVFASPQPQGGATFVFEDLTEKLELESRLNALVQLQRETLDYLSEAVAVFGPDGRLRLSNPIFAEMWGLSDEFLKARPHIRAVAETSAVGILAPEDGRPAIGWADFTRAVTGFDEGPRQAETGEFTLLSGAVKSYAVVPLPNGQTMLTFIDVSDARQAERMLRERNEALENADRIKSAFVQHVNYELRSPLTNIIGFSALLRSPETGPLTERQSEYLDYISTSTSSLLTIVNDILDLATIDAGIMELELSEVVIAKVAEHAADGIRDRLRENELALEIDVAAAGKSFRADGHRVTQILFNLLSNAANFAPAGSTIALKAWRKEKAVYFAVSDEGPGIAPAQLAKVFERFESDPSGGRQSGAGLGLSIVKSFVELHGGAIDITSSKETGTVVTCRFPLHVARMDEAAE